MTPSSKAGHTSALMNPYLNNAIVPHRNQMSQQQPLPGSSLAPISHDELRDICLGPAVSSLQRNLPRRRGRDRFGSSLVIGGDHHHDRLGLFSTGMEDNENVRSSSLNQNLFPSSGQEHETSTSKLSTPTIHRGDGSNKASAVQKLATSFSKKAKVISDSNQRDQLIASLYDDDGGEK